jgi:DEAD/DEAH box helicase domain-containing protein
VTGEPTAAPPASPDSALPTAPNGAPLPGPNGADPAGPHNPPAGSHNPPAGSHSPPAGPHSPPAGSHSPPAGSDGAPATEPHGAPATEPHGAAPTGPVGAHGVAAIDAGGVQVRLGEVTVTAQVVSYQRKRPSGELIETVDLDMPEQTLRTRAVWYTIDESLLVGAGLDADVVPGALHAAEHAAIGLLPLFAVCDRWDIGGMSTALHPDTGLPTVFVYDGHPGGAGFAERGFADVVAWLTATREAIRDCECPAGCPSCVQSPKCGNGNDPLDKAGAVVVLDIVLGALTIA